MAEAEKTMESSEAIERDFKAKSPTSCESCLKE